MRSVIAFSLLITPALSACGGNGERDDESATAEAVAYRLLRVGQDTLPAVLAVRDGCPVELDSASLIFPGDGTYRSAYHLAKACPGQNRTRLPDPGVEGLVTFSGDSASFLNDAGKPTGSGLLQDESLVVAGPEHTLLFVRSLPPKDR